MKEVNICFQVINKDNPYRYIGKAEINKDIIKFSDKDVNYLYDKKIKRLTKQSKDNTLVIDFQNQNILMKSDGQEFAINIFVSKCIIDEDKIEIMYKIDEDLINFIIEIREV